MLDYLYNLMPSEDELTYTQGLNAALLAGTFADWLSMSEEEKNTLILCGFYYDIGKYQDYTVESYYQAYRSDSLNNWESVPIEKTPFASANHEANDKKITEKGENYVRDERNLPPSNAPAK